MFNLSSFTRNSRTKNQISEMKSLKAFSAFGNDVSTRSAFVEYTVATVTEIK